MNDNTQQRKTQQLKMNPSTASQKLVKDILYSFILRLGLNECFQCGDEMERDNFSIEHKIPWLDSEDPIDLFFNLDNISFSHHVCNVNAARRKARTVKHGTRNEYDHGKCRCELCTQAKRESIYEWREKVGHR
jgi:hypothetical protein